MLIIAFQHKYWMIMVERGGTTDLQKLSNYFAYKITDQTQDVTRIIAKTSDSTIPNHIQLNFKNLDKNKFEENCIKPLELIKKELSNEDTKHAGEVVERKNIDVQLNPNGNTVDIVFSGTGSNIAIISALKNIQNIDPIGLENSINKFRSV